jgi:CelD/BcsL family acetyltransferase involved in cellulose biosynthesis
LRNLAKRLAEAHGELEFSLHPDGRSPDEWIDAFLDLERTGWKGRSGSALACGGDTEALFRSAITRGCRMGMAHLATLKAGGRSIAMTSWFVTELQGYGFKMAYDEEFSAFAPGQLLMQRVAELVDSQPELDFDTCSAPDSQNTKYLWPHRRELFDCVVGIGSPLRRLQLRLVMFLRSAWRRTRAGRGGGE